MLVVATHGVNLKVKISKLCLRLKATFSLLSHVGLEFSNSSPAGPGEDLRVFRGVGVFDMSGFSRRGRMLLGASSYLRQISPCSCCSSDPSNWAEDVPAQGRPLFQPKTFYYPLHSLHYNLLLDQAFILKSTEKMKLCFQCHVLTSLLHFDVSEALCACDCWCTARGEIIWTSCVKLHLSHKCENQYFYHYHAEMGKQYS